MGPVFEVPFGIVNGFNTLFTLRAPYVPNTTVVFLNGQAKVATYQDGWVEMGGKNLQLKIPPQTGDIIQVYYMIAG